VLVARGLCPWRPCTQPHVWHWAVRHQRQVSSIDSIDILNCWCLEI
jgi:hypothetical protein